MSSLRTAPCAALLAFLFTSLCLTLGAAHAAPMHQAPTLTAGPTTELTVEPTAQPSATTPPSAPSEPTIQPTAEPTAIVPVATPAQTLSLAISKTLVGSDVVQVGQYLTFTIRITNTGTAVVTDLPLIDEYETSILQPALERITPPPTSSAPGVLRWLDLTTNFGDLAPGESVLVTAVFRALRIDDEVINRARVESDLGSGGGGGVPFEDDAGGRVRGGQVIVEKALVESFINLDTPVISFTLSLRNDGYTDIVRAPLVDTYRADLLSFISASVPPDSHNPVTGELRWNNLLAGLGVPRLRPQESVSFTTVYSVTGPIEDAVVNGFNAIDVEDEFGNRVESPRRAEVRIRIRGPGADATPTPEEERRPRRTATPAPALTPAPEATPTATAATPTTATTSPTPTTDAAPTSIVEITTTPAATGQGSGESTPTPATPATLPAAGAATPSATPWLFGLLALAAGLALRRAMTTKER